MNQSLTFKLVDQGTHKLVLSWLKKPHVREFFHGQGLQNTLTDLNSDQPTNQHWIAFQDGVPFGYLITSEVYTKGDEDIQFTKHMKPGEKAITLDLLIGEEEFLGKGLASKMTRELLLRKFSHIDVVFIDPEVANTKATHIYEKIGFKKLGTFIAEWNPVPHWLMMMHVRDLP